MACFADISVSQGSVATYARFCGIFNMLVTANLPRNLPVKKIVNRLRFGRIMVMSLWPRFLAHPVSSAATYADNVALHAFARRLVDRYLLPAGPTAANLRQRLCSSRPCWDRQSDRHTSLRAVVFVHSSWC